MNAQVEEDDRATLCQLLVITRQIRRRLKWDTELEISFDDDEATALLDRPRRPGWEVPDL